MESDNTASLRLKLQPVQIVSAVSLVFDYFMQTQYQLYSMIIFGIELYQILVTLQ